MAATPKPVRKELKNFGEKHNKMKKQSQPNKAVRKVEKQSLIKAHTKEAKKAGERPLKKSVKTSIKRAYK